MGTLERRIKAIRNHKEVKSVRVYGCYHPLTIESVKLMFGIYANREALQDLYDRQKSVAPMMKIAVNDSGILEKRQIEKTLVEIVRALTHNIKNKSRQYGGNNNKKTTPLEAIFMLNNYHYVVKTIENTELESACGQKVIERLRKDIMHWRIKYETATWHETKRFIEISKLK